LGLFVLVGILLLYDVVVVIVFLKCGMVLLCTLEEDSTLGKAVKLLTIFLSDYSLFLEQPRCPHGISTTSSASSATRSARCWTTIGRSRVLEFRHHELEYRGRW
jgi:hypothetical protein